jgi:hypothetical protein
MYIIVQRVQHRARDGGFPGPDFPCQHRETATFTEPSGKA